MGFVNWVIKLKQLPGRNILISNLQNKHLFQLENTNKSKYN